MKPEENHTLKVLSKNVNEVNKVSSTFTADDYYVMIKKPEIIFNDKVKKLLKEKISNNSDHLVLLDEVRVIFSGELRSIDFVFRLVKIRQDDILYSYHNIFTGVATNYFLADILGMQENCLKVFKLFLKEELDGKTFQLSLNKYASDVCESILLW